MKYPARFLTGVLVFFLFGFHPVQSVAQEQEWGEEDSAGYFPNNVYIALFYGRTPVSITSEVSWDPGNLSPAVEWKSTFSLFHLGVPLYKGFGACFGAWSSFGNMRLESFTAVLNDAYQGGAEIETAYTGYQADHINIGLIYSHPIRRYLRADAEAMFAYGSIKGPGFDAFVRKTDREYTYYPAYISKPSVSADVNGWAGALQIRYIRPKGFSVFLRVTGQYFPQQEIEQDIRDLRRQEINIQNTEYVGFSNLSFCFGLGYSLGGRVYLD